MSEELKELIIEFIIKNLELQKTKIECQNLGFNRNESDKRDIKLLEMAIKFMEDKK